VATATGSAHAQQQETATRPARPNFVLTPSVNPGEPAGPMSGLQVIEGLERPTSTSKQTQHGNWVIAPLPFRNELLGAGLVLGAGYLYGASETEGDKRHSVAGVAGMYAEGGSWAALAAHRGYWSEQRYRTTTAIATGDLQYNIELSGAGTEREFGLSQEFSGATLQGSVRVGAGGWLGAGYSRGTTDIRILSPPLTLPDGLAPTLHIDISNVLLNGEFDTRDNDLYARSGHYAQAKAVIASEDLGSDDDYQSLELEWNAYRPFGERQVLALRIAGKITDGEPPFFALAWYGSGVDLRGYTPGRYMGESMVAAQAEWRWQATPRWGFVAFGGTGKVSGALGDIETDSWLPAGGAGVRFRLTKALPLNLRADFAWGRDDSTFSLAVGEAF
jgi:hypothetical protein